MAEQRDESMPPSGDESRGTVPPESRKRRSSGSLPQDRFDRLPRSGRTGAHRLVARPHRFWQYLVAALVGVAVLTAAGVFALQNAGGSLPSFFDSTEEAPEVPQVKPELDPEATIAVLNGTETAGLEASVGQVITDNGWGQIGFTEVAATNDVSISAVFYVSPDDEAAAKGLAKELGGVSTYQSDEYGQYGVRLIVLLGSDYAGPGIPEASE